MLFATHTIRTFHAYKTVHFYHATACNATHGMSMRKLSIRTSVKCVDCDKKNKTCAHILIPYERMFIIAFRHKGWLMGDDPLYLKFWAKLTPFDQKL